MSRRGCKPSHEPALAYDVRRYLTLVQVLAQDGSDEHIRALCELWGIEVVEDRSIPPHYSGRVYMNQWATIKALAKHVIDYHSKEQPR